MKGLRRLLGDLDAAAARLKEGEALSEEQRAALDVLKSARPGEADLEEASSPRPGPARRSVRVRAAGGLAAAALLVLGAWWLTSLFEPEPAIQDLWLSSREEPAVRGGAGEQTFQGGGRVFVHFRLGRPGWACLAALDSRLELTPASSGARAVEAGEGFFAIRLPEEGSGAVSFILFFGPRPLEVEEFRRFVAALAAAAPEGQDRAARLAFLAARARGEFGLEASAASFVQTPR